MAYNFDSGQFNKESTPKRLGNWEVPRWSPTKPRPLAYRPDPKPICDINGRFLPGAPRGTSRCFGHYTGTWDLPTKITREIAARLAKEPPDNRFPDWLRPRIQRPKAEAARAATSLRSRCGKKPDEGTYQDKNEFQDETKRSQSNALCTEKYKIEEECSNNEKYNVEEDPLDLNEKNEPYDPDGNAPYIPGSLTDPEKRHESFERMVESAVEEIHGPQENNEEKFWRKVADNAKVHTDDDVHNSLKTQQSKTPKLPSVDVQKNFNFAKKMHVENLEHQPLPDTLDNRKFQVGEHRDSEIIVKPYAIGWKGYGASGPSCCTKMRVHRPKTSVQLSKVEENDIAKRPLTSSSDSNGPQKKPLSLIDLAIRWDCTNDDPKKAPKHIDGTNGSKAPAVFAMIDSTENVEDNCLKSSHTNPIFHQYCSTENFGRHPVPYFEKDMTKEKPKDSCDVQHCKIHSLLNEKSQRSSLASRSSRSEFEKNQTNKEYHVKPNDNCKTTEVKNAFHENAHVKETKETKSEASDKLNCQSSVESTLRSNTEREDKDNIIRHNRILSTRAKKYTGNNNMEAGNHITVQRQYCADPNLNDTKEYNVPRIRHPYTKRSYTIPTLAPPFSILRNTDATGYPEQWRLASVYQHAFKHPEQRKKPLLASVYH